MAYTTRQSLLDALRNNQESAWQEFRETYAPLVRLLARRHHLTDTENDELLQDVCVTMFHRKALEKYNPEEGRFRTYLGRIISNCAVDLIRRRPPAAQPISTRRFTNLSSSPTSEEEFEEEWKEFLLEKALAEVRSRCDDLTYMAFEFHARQKRPAKEVAEALGVSEQKVFEATTRITQRLKKAIDRLKQEFDQP